MKTTDVFQWVFVDVGPVMKGKGNGRETGVSSLRMGCAVVLPAADCGFERQLSGCQREFASKMKIDVQDNVEMQDRLRPVSSQNGMRRSTVKHGTSLCFKGRKFTVTFRD